MVSLYSLLRQPQLLLLYFCLDPEVGKLVSKSLRLYPQSLSLVLANLDLLI